MAPTCSAEDFHLKSKDLIKVTIQIHISCNFLVNILIKTLTRSRQQKLNVTFGKL